MKLHELIGKHAIRIKPVSYRPPPTFKKIEDKSYTDNPIYVRAVTARKIRYGSPIGDNHKWVNSTFDVDGPFDDDNWEEIVI